MKDWFKLAHKYNVLPLIFVQMILVGLGEAILPTITMLFSKILNSIGKTEIYHYMIYFCTFEILFIFIRWYKISINVNIREVFAHKYRSDMFEKVCNLNLHNLQSYSISKLTHAVNTAYKVCEDGQSILMNIVGISVSLFTSISILWNADSLLTTAMILLSVVVGIVFLSLRKKWEAIYKIKKECGVKLLDYISRIEGFLTIKSFTKERYEARTFRSTISDEYRKIAIDTKRGVGKRLVTIAIGFTIFELGLLVYLLYTYNGDLAHTVSLGMLFYSLENYIFTPVIDLPEILDHYSDMKVQIESNTEIMKLKPEYEGSIEVKSFEESIVFKNVDFSYEDSIKDALKGVSLTIKKGEKVGIYGPSGSGKSTFVNLLLRFFKVDNGEILIDGENINSFTNKSLRRIIGNMSQEIFIFSDMTIKENIGYGLGSYTDPEIIEAAKKANAHEFISKLENGYNSKVGNNGVKLSGGERQRIALARLFLVNPPVLIFDEVTSKLDNESERLIKQSIDELSKDKTVISIAHRLSTIKDSDVLIGIKDGNIEEYGTGDYIKEHGKLWQHLSQQIEL